MLTRGYFKKLSRNENMLAIFTIKNIKSWNSKTLFFLSLLNKVFIDYFSICMDYWDSYFFHECKLNKWLF